MKYSLNFRIWHWLNALVIIGLIATVVLRKSFLSYKTNAQIVVTKLSEIGTDIALEDAKIIAKAIRAPMWEWHIILGFALSALLLYRVALHFMHAKQKEPFNTLSTHKKMVQLLYCALYAALFFMSISGLSIYYSELLGLGKELTHTIKEAHEAVFAFIAIFVPLHITGVVIAENKDEAGIVSTMINGKISKL